MSSWDLGDFRFGLLLQWSLVLMNVWYSRFRLVVSVVPILVRERTECCPVPSVDTLWGHHLVGARVHLPSNFCLRVAAWLSQGRDLTLWYSFSCHTWLHTLIPLSQFCLVRNHWGHAATSYRNSCS